MQTADRVALVLLGVLWSGGFLFTRIAVPAFGPLALVDLRVLIAGVVLLAVGDRRARVAAVLAPLA